jgi:hypothetical protein
MKLTEEQIKNLQKYLHDALSYRETYEEIYDHILSAMEFQPEGVSFEDAINNIIRDDFGGVKNLVKIERASKSALVNQSLNKFLDFGKLYFKLPFLLYNVLGCALAYYLLQRAGVSMVVIECALLVMTIVVPGIIYHVRLFNTGYFLDTTRRSAKDKMFENLAGVPVRLFIILNFWVSRTSTFNEWFTSHPYIIIMIIMFCTIYNLALYRLYRDEFKMAMTK